MSQVVVDHFLVQRLRHAPRDAPMTVPLAEQRVEHPAGVIDGDDPLQHRLAGLDVNLDDGQVSSADPNPWSLPITCTPALVRSTTMSSGLAAGRSAACCLASSTTSIAA